MTLWKPTRREFIKSAPIAIGSAALPHRVWAAPPSTSLRFLVVGDWGRRGHDYQRHVASGMQWIERNFGADFVVSTGDNFYDFGVQDKHASAWQESYVNIYGPLVQKRWFPVLGNHDYIGNPSAQLGGYENTGWWMPARNYIVRGVTFGHAEVDLFLVDTTMWNGGNGFLEGLVSSHPFPDSPSALHRWLPEQLAQSTAPIKLVFGHHVIYSVGPHGGKRKTADLEEVLKDAGVTAYIHGHDHCLYHIRDPLLDYICSGGGSQVLHRYTGGPATGCVLADQCRDGGRAPIGSPQWLHYSARAGFALFEVSPSRVHFRFFDAYLTEIHSSDIPVRIRPTATL